MKLLNEISRIGIRSEMPYQLKRQVLLSNYISLILSGSIVLLVILRFLFFGIPPDQTTVGISVMFLVPIAFNRAGLTLISRILLCVLPVAGIWYAFVTGIKASNTVDSTMLDGARIFLVGCSLFPYLVFGRTDRWLLIAGVAPTLISLIYFNQLMQYFGIPIDPPSLGSHYMLQSLRSLIAYLIINSCCFVLLAIVSENDATNYRLILDLNEKSERIKNQNFELVQRKLELTEMNKNLEELVEAKTLNIMRQNHILSQYAFTNAHRLRSPVAKILGFIEVSRLDTDVNYPWFFDRIEAEVIEIDKVIMEITENLNSLDSFSS